MTIEPSKTVVHIGTTVSASGRDLHFDFEAGRYRITYDWLSTSTVLEYTFPAPAHGIVVHVPAGVFVDVKKVEDGE